MITKEEYRARVKAFARELLRAELEKEILRRAAFEREAQEAAEADVGGIFEVESVSRRVIRTSSSRVVTVEEVHASARENAEARAESDISDTDGAVTDGAATGVAATDVADTEKAAAPTPPRREAANRAEETDQRGEPEEPREPEERGKREKLSPEERQLRRRCYQKVYSKRYYREHREELREYYRRRYREKRAGK